MMHSDPGLGREPRLRLGQNFAQSVKRASRTNTPRYKIFMPESRV